mmetsp:Transcript_30018/g.82361  ORF Transcript_30018/g.82361 Transcript_30018/m.82361 type:complete len:1108 (+) Transcript_30018:57-3380(+)
MASLHCEMPAASWYGAMNIPRATPLLLASAGSLAAHPAKRPLAWPAAAGRTKVEPSTSATFTKAALAAAILNAAIAKLWLRRRGFRRVAMRASASIPSWRRRKNAKLYRELNEGDHGKADRGAAPSSTRRRPLRKPEVLAPAGGWPQLRAAVRNGADAVYLGLDLGLNARARAANFSGEELPAVMAYLHERGVKAYVTLNTLVFDHELFGESSESRYGAGAALEALRCVDSANVDAVIVQDIGLALACRRLCPDVPVHASTQMSITSAAGVRFANEVLGASRVVLGRELSVAEIAAVCRDTPGVEIEAFVHGALCVSYSGQCFSSEAWGGRSANRGQCAQACRMPYGLVRDGELVGLGDGARYLLSPQDLMALDHVKALTEAGVGCLKIEGRLKSEEYVALTTAAYRDAVDRAWAALGESEAATVGSRSFKNGRVAAILDDPAARRAALAQVFARGQDAEHDGLSPGFLDGARHQRLVRGLVPKHRGVLAGTVAFFDASGPRVSIVLRLSAAVASVPLRRGTGLVFDRVTGKGVAVGDGGREVQEAGGFVCGLQHSDGTELDSTEGFCEGDEVVVIFDVPYDARGDAALERLRSAGIQGGDLVWRTKDATLESQLRHLELRGLPGMEVSAEVAGVDGEPLRVQLMDSKGNVGVGESDESLSAARKHALGGKGLDEALKLKPGGPPPEDGNVQAGFWRGGAGIDKGSSIATGDLEPGLFLPRSQVQRARQRAAQDLMQRRQRLRQPSAVWATPGTPVASVCSLAKPPVAPPASWLPELGAIASTLSPTLPKITVLCRSWAQAEAAIALSPGIVHEVLLDFLEVRGLEAAIAAARSANVRVAACLPRVLKPGEDKIWRLYLRLGADALVVRSAGALHELLLRTPRDSSITDVPPLVGDFSLNAANALAAATLLAIPGLDRLTPAHDLSAPQICQLARGLGPERAARLEVVAHQHLPIFHTEHCVFCRFLTKGNDFTDCGHPCERGSLHLRDASGKDHRVLADMGCRNTVFNAEAQSAARDLDALVAAGVGFLRLELVDEPGEAVAPLVQHYHDALRGVVDADALWKFVATLPDSNGLRQGVGRGSLDGALWRERSPTQLRPAASAARAR